MAPQYNIGDSITYMASEGHNTDAVESTGVIRDIFTNPGRKASRGVKAIEEETRYDIENSKTGRFNTVDEKDVIGMVPTDSQESTDV